jgi:N-acetylmuramoyl-L-alanine amidase
LRRRRQALLALLALAAACALAWNLSRRGEVAEARSTEAAAPPFVPGTALLAAGERLEAGTPIILFEDPVGFDAYALRCFSVNQPHPIESDGTGPLERYGRRTPRGLDARSERAVREGGWNLGLLQRQIRALVLHYDAVGTSTRCFRALHDRRGLSCHFLLDLDGTIYQTLDLREAAWHAKPVNDWTIGVEIANLGASPTPRTFGAWYVAEGDSVVIRPPAAVQPGRQFRDIVLRPRRPEPVAGSIHGQRFVQYDFTPEQYLSLARLAAALNRHFPRIRLEVPRDARGEVLKTVLPPAARDAFEGILGHFHVSRDKYDPGPAFDWSGFLAASRALAGR